MHFNFGTFGYLLQRYITSMIDKGYYKMKIKIETPLKYFEIILRNEIP